MLQVAEAQLTFVPKTILQHEGVLYTFTRQSVSQQHLHHQAKDVGAQVVKQKRRTQVGTMLALSVCLPASSCLCSNP